MPSLAEALNNVQVQNILLQSWNRTQQHNVEWGGLIIYDPAGQSYTATSRTDNQNSSIVLTNPADLQNARANGRQIVADYHCHPGTVNNVAAGRPSDADITNGRGLSYARIVLTYDTNHEYGPEIYRKALPGPSPSNFPANTCVWKLV